MLRFLYGTELGHHARLSDTMFRDRAAQFYYRQGWDVNVDGDGHERDSYDDQNPLYVIWQRPDGAHGGSMRLLPTTGPAMINDHFSHLLGDGTISSPLIWECTRFCLAPEADTRIAAALMLGGAEIMDGFGIEHFVGVFDARMERIYRAVGSSPTMLGSAGTGRARVSAGLWSFCRADKQALLRRARLTEAMPRHWFLRAFGPAAPLAESA